VNRCGAGTLAGGQQSDVPFGASRRRTKYLAIYRDIETLQDLEREYSPSSCIADIGVYLRSYSERSETARRLSPHLQSLDYGPDPVEKLDWFPAGDVPGRGLHAYIHGGYWQELGKNESSFPAIGLNRAGFDFAALSYGLAPAATLDQMVDRCRRAIVWMHRHAARLGIRNGIYLSGCSAGAHLAAMVLLTDWREQFGLEHSPIAGALLLSGIYDLEPIPLTYINQPLGLDARGAARNSPLRVASAAAHLPPVLVAVGDNETGEFKRQSRAFAAHLEQLGASVHHMVVANRNHFDLIFDFGRHDTFLGRRLDEHMRFAWSGGATPAGQYRGAAD